MSAPTQSARDRAFTTRRVFCVQCQEWRDSISPLNLASGKSFCSFGCYDLYFSAAERATRKMIADVLAACAVADLPEKAFK